MGKAKTLALIVCTSFVGHCTVFAQFELTEFPLIGTAQSGTPAGPVGACCVDGSCLPNLTQTDCVVGSCGQWRGVGSTCQGLLCAVVFGGVCCTDGVCSTQTAGSSACACSGGTWFQAFDSCTGLVCPGGPLGACCVDGSCVPDLTKEQCEVQQCGIWSGAGSNCSGSVCSVPVNGVCCLGITCDPAIGMDACDCAGGRWVPDALDCAGVICLPATGRCCDGATCTEDVTEAACDATCGVWGGVDSTCAGLPAPCPLNSTACCVGTQCIGGLSQSSCVCEGGIFHAQGNCFVSNQTDCDGNGIIDLCEPFADCNSNGVPDECDISTGTSADCNLNAAPDECDISSGASQDCNTNTVPDECETGSDCNENSIPDECELAPNCFLKFPLDCNFDGLLNECDPDCQPNAVSDVCELVDELVVDCAGGGPDVGQAFFGQLLHNANCSTSSCHGVGGNTGAAPNHRNFSRYRYQWKVSGCVFHPGGTFVFTETDFANLEAYLSDLGGGGNGVPDECEGLPDCDLDGIADECVLAAGTALDCDGNGIPDSCDITSGFASDCNTNGVPDQCDIDGGASEDCNNNNVPDECDIAQGTSQDCNLDGIPNECDPDCNATGISDLCEILSGTADCDMNSIPDECEADCNSNGVVDACDISHGTSSDLNGNGIPDECEADCNNNGIPDDLELLPGDAGKTAVVDYGANGPLIPDCGGPTSGFLADTLMVDFAGSCAIVEHLKIDLELTHSWIGDVVVEVESPSGTVVTLLSRIGLEEVDPACAGGECCGLGVANLKVELDDDNVMSIEDAASSSGQYHPDAGATGNSGTVTAFTGEIECGTWTLRVYDGALFDTGMLNGWTLDLRTFPLDQDCNGNGVPDQCDIDDGTSSDCNVNEIPDDCEDCNDNGLADECDLSAGASDDCNANGVPDECDGFRDCNANGILDDCDITAGTSIDCNGNGAPDDCDLSGFGGLFVTGFNSDNVIQYGAASGFSLGEFVAAGSGGLDSPAGLTFGRNGNLLVADIFNQAIREYDGDTGAYLNDFVDTPISGASDMIIGPNGNLFVITFQNGTVTEFDGLTGALIGVFATLPPSPVPERAFNLTFGSNGNLLIPVFSTGEVLGFDGITGAFIAPFTSGGTLAEPMGITFGPNGNLFVADPTTSTVQEFNGVTGDFVGIFVDNLFNGGAFFSAAMVFGPDGDLYIAHSLGNVVARFDGVTGAFIGPLGAELAMGGATSLKFRPPSSDCNSNAVPDECEDCNGNGLADACDIAAGTSQDVDDNGIPDECEGADIVFELVIRATDSGLDVASTLPESDLSVERSDTFFVEVWTSDRGVVNTGLEEAYVDVTFDAAVVQVLSIDHRPPFKGSIGGSVDNVGGTITDLGGIDVSASGAGVEPQWARLAVVQLDAVGCPAAIVFWQAQSGLDVVAVGRGVIAPQTIDYGAGLLSVLVDCIYDLDGSGFVNAGDSGLFAGCWLTGTGDPGFDPACDFDCSGFVDAADAGWFAAAWLHDCDVITEGDLPACHHCQSGGENATGRGEDKTDARAQQKSARRAQPTGRPTDTGW